ncbi:DUF4118 domain-containing protein [Dactylosporangium aurantiacum]|uniref:histidine kinase n=1 Tax=Dactylosporangium aurantiacum TaxID=35754 RepID=A0A9Q9MFV3_9ACTN|nr:DUF4118 domain-containing protein [Dactylosporangium aurantiacum]MDG6103097.1 DUF4118 domain-containing protein [Dactylosporangium aurantiacum]UWZ57608.1 DUF4118 domain-containing protein [Dactylosporangium aurantiacum]
MTRPEPPPFSLGVLVAVVFIAVETLAMFVFSRATHQHASGIVYLIGVLAVSVVWGARLGLMTSLASAIVYNYVHTPPFAALRPLSGGELRDMGIFTIAALLVSALSALTRYHAREAWERRRETDLSAELARLMLGSANLDAALRAGAMQLKQALDLPFASIELEAMPANSYRTVFPLRDGTTVLGTFVVPADLPAHTMERLQQRVVPALRSLLRAARDRADMIQSLQASREKATSLAKEQAALRRVATLVARGASPADVFKAVAKELGVVLGGYPTTLLRYETDGTATRVAGGNILRDRESFPLTGDSLLVMVRNTGHAARINDYKTAKGANAEVAQSLGVHSGVGVPVIVERQIWGVALVMSTALEPLPADTEIRMARFTDLVATAVANAESRTQLIASRARIIAASDEARRQVERDIHDGAQQRLVALGLQLRMLESSIPPELEAIRDQASQAANIATGIFEDLREIAHGIHPAIHAKGGLGPAVRTLARRSPTPVDLKVDIDQRLPEQVEVGAYYVVSEALTNAAKHANASTVHVDVESRDAFLRLSVRDDGIGGADTGNGSGLIGLRDRVETLGGHMDLQSPTGLGTTLLVKIPIDHS